MFLRKLSKLRNGVHRQLGAGIEFDIDLHELRYVKTQTSRVTGWQVSFENRYVFGFFHMPDEPILVLDFINRIGWHFSAVRSNFGANEKKLPAVQSLGHTARNSSSECAHRARTMPAARAIATRSVPVAVAVFLLPDAS